MTLNENENKLFVDYGTNQCFAINYPPTMKVIPQKDMTGYESWKLFELGFRYINGDYPSREELEGVESGVRRHFEIEERV